MKIRLLTIACLVGFNFLAQLSRADIPPVQIVCRSLNNSNQTQLTGEFREVQNRHGAGELQFKVTRLGTELSRTGGAQSWAVDQIDYSDSSMQVSLLDSNYYSGNISNINLNGISESLICQFKRPVNTVCPGSCIRNHR